MRVLVSAASKHGATSEIASTIASALDEAGPETVVREPAGVERLDEFDAFVIGSAVYAGRWLGPARMLVEREAERLRGRPVWLFSSGPIGNPPKPETEPVDGAGLRILVGAREHRVFAGRLDRERLGLAEKLMVRAVRAPEGDFRGWQEIRAWAKGIAGDLRCS